MYNLIVWSPECVVIVQKSPYPSLARPTASGAEESASGACVRTLSPVSARGPRRAGGNRPARVQNYYHGTQTTVSRRIASYGHGRMGAGGARCRVRVPRPPRSPIFGDSTHTAAAHNAHTTGHDKLPRWAPSPLYAPFRYTPLRDYRYCICTQISSLPISVASVACLELALYCHHGTLRTPQLKLLCGVVVWPTVALHPPTLACVC
jgi:hypothetical protein